VLWKEWKSRKIQTGQALLPSSSCGKEQAKALQNAGENERTFHRGLFRRKNLPFLSCFFHRNPQSFAQGCGKLLSPLFYPTKPVSIGLSALFPFSAKEGKPTASKGGKSA